jgi:hypothetical protein
MQLSEHPAHTYLLGGVDEISAYQYNIESLAGSYKKELVSNTDLYNSTTNGSIAGEGCAMFVLNKQKEGAVAYAKALSTLHTENKEEVAAHLQQFIAKNTANTPIDLFITGENGDIRYLPSYKEVYNVLCTMYKVQHTINKIQFKHLSGEYPTASSFALWLACQKIKTEKLTNILIYNNYQGKQHSFILVDAV